MSSDSTKLWKDNLADFQNTQKIDRTFCDKDHKIKTYSHGCAMVCVVQAASTLRNAACAETYRTAEFVRVDIVLNNANLDSLTLHYNWNKEEKADTFR